MPLMAIDVIELREFYAKPAGKMVLGLLRRRLTRLWTGIKAETVVSFGYGASLLRPWLEDGNHVIALMPGRQGAIYWPREQKNRVCLCEGANWPLADESVDRVILVHALESAPDPEALLREAWRVLKGDGHLLAIVPNRRGSWAHTDKTPFGTGQPYTAAQIRQLLHGKGFSVTRETEALFFPPFEGRFFLALAERIEKLFSRFSLGFGGLLIVDSVKQVYAPILTKSHAQMRKRLVFPTPFSSSPGRTSSKRS